MVSAGPNRELTFCLRPAEAGSALIFLLWSFQWGSVGIDPSLERTFQPNIQFCVGSSFPSAHESTLASMVSNENVLSFKFFSPQVVSFLCVFNIYIFLFVFLKFDYDVPRYGLLWVYSV